MGRHYLGKRNSVGALVRFWRPLTDAEFTALLANSNLPAGWVAWHLEDDETASNSARARALRDLPIWVLSPDGWLREMPTDGEVTMSEFPLADPLEWLRLKRNALTLSNSPAE